MFVVVAGLPEMGGKYDEIVDWLYESDYTESQSEKTLKVTVFEMPLMNHFHEHLERRFCPQSRWPTNDNVIFPDDGFPYAAPSRAPGSNDADTCYKVSQ